jgi:hypothetical protein
LDRTDRALLDRVGDGDQPGGMPIDRDQHYALSIFAQRVGLLGQTLRLNAKRGE